MGSYLSRFFPLLFALFILKEKKKLELYFMSLFFLLLSGLVLISGERAAYFLYVLSFIFIIIFVKGYKKLRIVLSVGSVIIITIISQLFKKLKCRAQFQTKVRPKKSSNHSSPKPYIFVVTGWNFFALLWFVRMFGWGKIQLWTHVGYNQQPTNHSSPKPYICAAIGWNDDTQNYPFFQSKVVVEMFGHSTKKSKFCKSPKSCRPTNENTLL